MKKITLVFAILFAAGLTSSRGQDTWTQKADFGGTARDGAVGFSIGSKGYIGIGEVYPTLYNDFWEYDPATDAWTQKANFGGTARVGAVGFSIGSKGYIGTGTAFNSVRYNDFWEYDPVTNAWTQKANFGGTPRNGAVGFSIGGKGYIGTGYDGGFKNDFWEYDPATNAWTQDANFHGTHRWAALGFSIGSKGYIGTGFDNSGYKNDFWEYDPVANTWSQKANFGGATRDGAEGFSIGSKGYIGSGSSNVAAYNDFWEYDPSTNTWTQKANFGGTVRSGVAGFSIGSKGYIGTGETLNDNFKDFWEYTPEGPTCDPCPLPLSIYISDITSSSAIVHWTGNSCAYSYRIRKRPIGSTTWIKSNVNAPDTSKKITNNLPDTTYEVQVQTFCDSLKTDSSGYSASVYFFSGCINPSVTYVSATPDPICKGSSATLTVNGTLNGAASWQWYSASCGGTSEGSGASITKSPSSTTTYYVRGEGGCVTAGNCSPITVTVNSKPKAKITALGSLDICTTGSVDLQAKSGNNYTYQWKLNDSNISEATGQIYHATQTGDYKVKVTSGAGCSKTSKVTTVYTSCKLHGQVSNQDVSAFEIYPNPAEDVSTIQFTLTQSSHVSIRVYDVSGKEIATVVNADMEQGDHSMLLNTNHFSKGVYLVKMISDFGIENQKLIVQ